MIFGTGCFITYGSCATCCFLTVGSAVMTPYFVGRGTVEGARDAVPESTRREHRTAIFTAIAEVDVQQLARGIEEERRRRSAAVTVTLPTTESRRTKERPTYRDAASHGVDTVAEVTLLRFGLQARSAVSSQSIWKVSVPEVDPPLGLWAEARLRLVTAADDTVLFETTYVHRSSRDAKLAEWGRDGAAEFRKARDEALDALARDVATGLFGADRPTEPPPEETSRSEP